MSDHRTLILLGGSRQQVVAIEKARECGYRTVLCDYLPDNPGQHVADAFYQVSTTDREAVLDVARKEHAEGIIAYSSDPAAPAAAFVAERLGLPTNPLVSVETMSVKTLFRDHLRAQKLPCPQSIGIQADAETASIIAAACGLKFPVVVKPTDSSGSKGVTVVDSQDQLDSAIQSARSVNRNGILILEEYIRRAFPNVIGGDVFVVGGKIRFWGLMSCLREADHPLVPVGKKLPSGLTERQISKAKTILQLLVNSLGIEFGELNIELMFGEDDTPYMLELGARAGGNMIPVLLSDASGIDLVRANVMCAMGDNPGKLDWEPSDEHFASYVLNAKNEGLFKGFKLSPEAESACYRKVIYQNPGTPVKEFSNAGNALGILFFEFDGEKGMNDCLARAADNVKVLVEN